MLSILRDPLWQGIAAIVAIIAGIIAFFPRAEFCEEPIFEEVQDIHLCGSTEETVIVTPERPKTCRRPEFGQVGYLHTQTFTENSNWRGGGSNPINWCNELAQDFISSRGIGNTATTEILNTDEKARWTGPFGRTREYNYECTLKVSWDPLYAERTDPACGMHPAETGTKQVTNICKKQVGTKKVKCS